MQETDGQIDIGYIYFYSTVALREYLLVFPN